MSSDDETKSLLSVQQEQPRVRVRSPLVDRSQRYFAEFIGTGLLVAIGDNAAMLATELPGVIGVAFGYCFGLMLNIWNFAGVSGAHFNPVVTLAFFILGHIGWFDSLMYTLAQIAGATVFSTLTYTLPKHIRAPTHFGCTTLAPYITPLEGILIETIGTFVLVFTILRITDRSRLKTETVFAPIVIPFALAGLILFCGELTGASFNPARSFGPAAVWEYWDNHYVYWLGPPAGSLLAVLLFKFFDL